MKKFTFVRDRHLVATLNVKGKPMPITLVKDGVYELPAENSYIRSLVARKWLVPVEATEKKKKAGEKPVITNEQKTND